MKILPLVLVVFDNKKTRNKSLKFYIIKLYSSFVLYFFIS